MAAYHSRHEKLRHGKHQKHTRNFLKVYTPYLPLVVIVLFGLVLGSVSPPKSHKNVLAYATSMSVNELLAATNQDRAANGKSALKINSKLNSAAQAKANDMVTRNYWAHVTPSGQQPWVFFTNAGYNYQAAAENLAYGFDNSDATVNGWMNSPEHKVNMLNGTYVDVGFGFASSSNFVNTGQETIVVAEYGTPVNYTPVVAGADTKNATPTLAKAKTAAPTTDKTNIDQNSVQTLAASEPASQNVTRIGKLTGAEIPWFAAVASITIALGVIALVVRHTYAINHWIRQGKRYVMHHFLFDITVVALIVVCVIANQSIGFIR